MKDYLIEQITAKGNQRSRIISGYVRIAFVIFLWILLSAPRNPAWSVAGSTSFYIVFSIALILSGLILFNYYKWQFVVLTVLISNHFLDILGITVLSYYTGGLQSPFLILYLIAIVFAFFHGNFWQGVSVSASSGFFVFLTAVLLLTGALPQYQPFTKDIPFTENMAFWQTTIAIMAVFIIFTLFFNGYMKRHIESLERSLEEKGDSLNDASRQLLTSFHELESMTDRVSEQAYLSNIAQNKLVQADKLSSYGMVVAGIINEFNNPVSCILTDVESILINSGDSLEPRVRRSLERAMDNAEKVRILAKNLNETVLPEGESTFEDLNLNKVIERIIDLYRPGLLRKSIDVSVKLDSSLPIILGVEGQIEQVLINLMNNSITSIGNNKGKIEIGTKIDHSIALLLIRHSGNEITVDSIERIFHSAVTNNLKEFGDNIGMYIVREIVDKHDGRIQVAQQGKSTMFTIQFPLRESE